MRDRFFPLFGLESPGAAVVATAGNLTEAPVGTFGNAAADAELAAVAIAADLGTTEAAVVPGVVLPLKLALLVAPVPGAFAAGVGLLLVSVFLFRLTVFFLVDVMAPAFLASAPLFLVPFDLTPPPLVAFLLVVLPLGVVEFELPAAVEDDGFGGGAMPNNCSSSKTLSSGASIDPPILVNLSRFDWS